MKASGFWRGRYLAPGTVASLREERLAQLVARDAMIGIGLPKRAEEVA
jgi:hypothetical protein